MLTQEYPADDLEKEFTPVVHFFTKEWVKLGHDVRVINLPTNFPGLYYALVKPFRRKMESKLSINLRTYKLSRREYELDNVPVLRLPLRKNKPHGRFPSKEINRAIQETKTFCEVSGFVPEVIIGHWTNPAVEVMLGLKKIYHVPTVLSMHDAGFDFRDIYKNEYEEMFKEIDVWGWRSYYLKRKFEKKFGERPKNFMCFSGVPEKYIRPNSNRTFEHVSKFLFVGLLMKYKHPLEYLKALDKSEFDDFVLDIVGQGDEAIAIRDYISGNKHLVSKVNLCGRIPRDNVSKKMGEADVFCMISDHETFGLVYIEAMAAGCITIAARDAGFDGIIKDGENGFLCEAGNEKELTAILNRIKAMTPAELKAISQKAIETAKDMTDEKVALNYIQSVENLIKT